MGVTFFCLAGRDAEVNILTQVFGFFCLSAALLSACTARIPSGLCLPF